MKQKHPPLRPNGGFRKQLDKAFAKAPDQAGILQGVRPMRTGMPHVRIVHVPSRKNGNRMIPCEGSLEEKAVLCLEIDPRVDAYRCQPFALPGPDGGRMVPDFAIRRGPIYSVIDIKPHGQLERETVVRRLRWLRARLSEAGIAHYLFTERSLEREPFLHTRLQLKAGLSIDLTEYQLGRLLAHLQDGPLTVRQLRTKATAEGISPFAVERLALLEQARFPLNVRWNESTPLEVLTHEHSTRTLSGWGTVRDVCLPL